MRAIGETPHRRRPSKAPTVMKDGWRAHERPSRFDSVLWLTADLCHRIIRTRVFDGLPSQIDRDLASDQLTSLIHCGAMSTR